MKKAILFGASGFIGHYVLQELLNNPDYEEVIIVVRKKLDINHPKLKTLIGNFNNLPDLKDQLKAEEVYIALGTTKDNTPDQKEYYQIDHDYPVLAARMAKELGAKSVFIVTAVGPNVKSSVFYIRMKGEIERDILALDYPYTHIFRPSMLLGTRKEYRPTEKIFIKIFSLINPMFIGSWSKYRGIDGKDVARAMVAAAKTQKDKVNIYEWKEMNALLN